MMAGLKSLWLDEDAKTTVEYALALSTVGVATVAAYQALGDSVVNAVRVVVDALQSASR